MGDKKSPTRPKRQAKPSADDGYWDCSVCTYRNSAEAFKCSICDVRKGTSTRKPRINSQLVAQQVAQQYPGPPPPKKEKRERSERPDKERGLDGEPRPDGEHPDDERPEGEHSEGDMMPEAEQRSGPEAAECPEAEPRPPERVRPEGGDTPEKIKEKSEKEAPVKEKEKEKDREKEREREREKEKEDREKEKEREKEREKGREKDREKEISPAVITKKPNSKKRTKLDSHANPVIGKHSLQFGKSATKTNKNQTSHISRPKLKNIDRSTAQQLAITVGNVTVIITDFKEKTRSSSTSSSTVTSSAGSEQQHQSSGSESMDKGSSRASTPKGGELSVGHDESF